MKTAIKMKLVNRLLTGKDKQVRYTLRKHDGFCVLGVLCDIYLQEHNQYWYDLHDDATLPYQVMAWSGLDSKQTMTLVRANDRDGVTFPGMVDLLMKDPIFDEHE